MWRTTCVWLLERHAEPGERHAVESTYFRFRTSIFHRAVELCTELSTGVENYRYPRDKFSVKIATKRDEVING